MKGKTKTLLSVSLILTFVLAAYLIKSRNDQPPEESYKEVETKVHDLKVIIQATGSVEPMNKVRVMPPVAGRMEKVLIKEGERVK